MGHPDAPATIGRALAEPQDPSVACHHNGAGSSRFRWLIMSDRLAEARATVTALLREVRRRGSVESEVHFLRGLAETELHSGHCGRALELARESLRLARDTGIGEVASAVLTSLAEAAGGEVDRALALAREAVEHAEEDGDHMYLSRALAALGHAQLVAGDAEAAVVSLRRVREVEQGLGITDPARGRWHGDLAEALVRSGEIGRGAGCHRRHARGGAAAGPRQASWPSWTGPRRCCARARGEQDAAVTQLTSAQDRLGSWATAWRRPGPPSPWPSCAPARPARAVLRRGGPAVPPLPGAALAAAGRGGRSRAPRGAGPRPRRRAAGRS